MSNTIDEKVVEMRFDNRDFEKNVKDTMKTLDEFKKQLNFSGASDGLENIAQHANKLNFNNLSNAIDTVNERFSTLGIMGVTVLQNITNSAINAGKRIVDSLTIAPIRSGYEEYELTLNTIKTVMNATNKSADEVKRQLKSLDDYADKTIYSTGDMFNNISKFTNVGVPLEDASTAMIGIANATALAGRGAREASIAMYNLGQAIGVGYLNRIDYKSLQNAGIDTNEWKEAMIDAAVAAGTLTKTQDGMYKSGKKLFTMQNLFIDGLQTQWATRDVMMKVLTDYGNQETDIGKKAWKAAQEVRTFSGMMEALKASVGTGWKETWELIFGDLDQATNFWTRINDFVSGIIGGFTKKRNEFLQGVLDPISPLLEKIGDSANAIKKTVNSVKDYVTVVDEIIQGKWGNGQKRFDALAKAGYDWAHAQNLVNEKLGNSKRLATDFSESQDDLNETEEKIIDTTGKYIQSLSEMDDATLLSTLGDQEKVDAIREIQRQADRLGLTVSELVDRSDELSGRTLIIESLANIGSSLIKIFESIGKAWKEAFPPITTDTVYDIIAGLYKLTNVIKKYVEGNADKLSRTLSGLFGILSVISNLISGAVRIAFTIFGKILGIFGKATSGVLDVTASLGDILLAISKILNDKISKVVNFIIDLINNGTGAIADLIDKNNLLGKSFDFIRRAISFIITPIQDFISKNEFLNNILNSIKNTADSLINIFRDLGGLFDILTMKQDELNASGKSRNQLLSEYLSKHPDLKMALSYIIELYDKVKIKIDEFKTKLSELGEKFKPVGENIIQGLKNGLISGFGIIKDALIQLVNKIKTTFCNLFGIHSPSTVFFEYGKNIIQGLINGISAIIPNIKEIFINLYNNIKDVSFSQIGSILFPLTSLIPQLGFLNLPRHFANLFSACGIESLAGLKQGLESNGGIFATIKSFAQKIIDKFKEILGINSPSKVFIAIGGFIISGLLVGLTNGFKNVPDTIKGFAQRIIDIFKNIDFGKVLASSIVIGSFLAIKKALTIFKSIADLAGRITAPLKGLGDALSGFGEMFKAKGQASIIAAKGEVIKSLAQSILMIAAAMFIISKIDNLGKAALTIGIITGVIIALYALLSYMSKNMTKSQRFVNNLNTFSNFIRAFAGCMILLAIAMKIMGKMKPKEISTGIIIMTGLMVIVGTLVAITSLAGRHADKAATFISKIGGAFLMLSIAMKIIGKLSPEEMTTGITCLTAFMVIIGVLIAITKMNGGKTADKTAKVISQIGGAFLMMSTAMKILSKLTPDEMITGISILTSFMIIIGVLIAITKMAGKNADKAGKMILSVSAAFLLLAACMKILGNLTGKEIAKGVSIITGFMVLVGILIKLSKYSGENAHKAGLMILEISAGLLLLSYCLEIIGKLEWKAIGKGISVITGFMLLVGLLIGLSKYAGTDADKAGKMILMVSGAILALTVCLVILAALDKDKMIDATTALCSIILSFGVALALMSKLKGSIGKAMPAIVALGAVILLLGVTLGILEHFNLTPSLETIEAISVLLLAMSASLILISKFGPISLKAVGAMAILGLVVAEIGLVFFMLKKLDVQPSLEAAEALSVLLLAMSVSLVILSTIGATATAAIAGAGALVAVVGIFIAAITGLGFLFEKIDGLEKYLDKGGQILIKIGDILGQFIGSLLVGIAKPFMDYLPEMSEKLSEFMDNLGPFITGAKSIDNEVLSGVSNLTLAIIELTAAELIQGIGNLMTVGNPLVDLGKNLKEFMKNALPFFVALKSLGPEVLTSTKILAEAMIAITAAELVQGLTSFLTFGKSNLEKFSEELPFLADGINGFIARLTDVSAEKLEIVKTAVEAIKAIAELASYDLGTVATNIGSFGEQLIIFGSRMNGFFGILSNIGLDTIQAGIDKVNNLVNLASNVASINVEQVSAFSNSLVEIATTGVIGFCDAFSNFEPKDKVRLATVAMIGAAILGAEETLPNLVNKFKIACSDILTHISSQYEAMRGVGVYFTEGFKKGIEEGTGPVTEAARVMAQAAMDAVKETIDSNSPSKETMKLGNYFGSGFAIGIKDYFNKVYDAAYTSGDLAKEGLSNAISKISSIIEDGIDTNPTIRPVLDLSDVEAGASYLGSMFGTNSIGLNQNLNSISNSFDSKIQNRSNSDILSAIKNLETTILTKCGNTTNIYTQELDSAKLDQIVAHVNREFGIMY